MQGVRGSNPLSSTRHNTAGPRPALLVSGASCPCRIARFVPPACHLMLTAGSPDGSCSVGVQRQYCGTLGTIPPWPSGGRPVRCLRGCGTGRSGSWCWTCWMSWTSGAAPVLAADAGYGEVGEFRQGLDDHQIPYVVQVKVDTSASPEHVHPTTAPYTGKSRPRPRYHHPPSSLKELGVAAGQQACVDLIWRRGSKGHAAVPVPGPAGPPSGDYPAPSGCRPCRRCRVGAAGALAAG